MSTHPPEHHDSRHPTFKQYVTIAIILFVITAIEFLIIVPEGLRGSKVVIAPLVALSALKFAIVIMFYMHLKFDNRLLGSVFITGLALAFAAGAAVLALFGSFQPTPREFAAANAVAYTHSGEADGHEEVEIEQPQPGVTPEGGTEEVVEEPAGGSDLVARGQEIFVGAGGCLACHTVEGVATGMVGPDLTHIGTEGANRQPGVSARDYITESITMPEAFIAEGVERANPGLMTSALTASLSDADIQALVEFLLAQE
jgi:mono/diheme cytochrome c family protein/heme/copper-type cytochrome/quinol oxidase subunit 4